jgi:SAM-dependent methyltransferase
LQGWAKRYRRAGDCGDVNRSTGDALARFKDNDAYRAEREWLRLQGTAQRDLFRELRQRFLSRHPGVGPWVLDAGSGPGRFTASIGPRGSRRVAADVGRRVLEQLLRHWIPPPLGPAPPDRVRADLVGPPFAPRSFGTVAALGNLLGFAGEHSDALREQLIGLLAPGATLIVEVAPGPGERSRYLGRLPPGAVARLLRAPVPAVRARVAREGFVPERPRKRTEGSFRRIDPVDLSAWLEGRGLAIREMLAVAPVLGADPERIGAVGRDPRAWDRLLEVEELVGRDPARWPHAAAVLLAAEVKSEG